MSETRHNLQQVCFVKNTMKKMHDNQFYFYTKCSNILYSGIIQNLTYQFSKGELCDKFYPFSNINKWSLL